MVAEAALTGIPARPWLAAAPGGGQRPCEDGGGGGGMVSGLPHCVPGATARCRPVVQNETAEVHPVLQAFRKCSHICCVPRTGLCGMGQGFPPAVQRLYSWGTVGEPQGARSPQNCVQDGEGDSPRDIRPHNVKEF